MEYDDSSYGQSAKRGFFQRFGFALGVLGIAAVVGIIFLGQSLTKGGKAAPRSAPEVMMVRIAPLPPPPPPPPPPPQAAEQKMISQTPVADDEQKPDEAPAPAAPDLGTSITGAGGPDAFGLSGGGGSGSGTKVGRRSSGSRWGWYAASVQRTIGDALRRNTLTRGASFSVEVRIWSDLTGRIARAQLGGTTGDAKLDAAIRDEVLTGLRLTEVPPRDMPLPIVLRLNARRPD